MTTEFLANAASPGRPLPQHYRRRVRPALFDRSNCFDGSGLGARLTQLTTFFLDGAEDNRVRIGRNFRTKGLVIEVSGQGNRLEIGDDVRLSGRIRVHGSRLSMRVGDRCDIKHSRFVAWDADVTVGNDCLIAAGVLLRSSDIHRIVDRHDGASLNPAASVAVGNRVWLAGEAALLKGARVPDGCVVGFRSVVTQAFDETDCVLVGTPARVIRRGIAWTR